MNRAAQGSASVVPLAGEATGRSVAQLLRS